MNASTTRFIIAWDLKPMFEYEIDFEVLDVCFFFQFCDVAQVAIIHKDIYPYFQIDIMHLWMALESLKNRKEKPLPWIIRQFLCLQVSTIACHQIRCPFHQLYNFTYWNIYQQFGAADWYLQQHLTLASATVAQSAF